jgi:CelD/BcsL family acetyltransferase involved in cellulose biosynthesis
MSDRLVEQIEADGALVALEGVALRGRDALAHLRALRRAHAAVVAIVTLLLLHLGRRHRRRERGGRGSTQLCRWRGCGSD